MEGKTARQGKATLDEFHQAAISNQAALHCNILLLLPQPFSSESVFFCKIAPVFLLQQKTGAA